MIILPIMLAAQTADTGPQTQKASLWVESSSVDVGKIKAGEDAVATFILHNDSDQPIKILKAKPS
jgi:copper(I)-binding protein